MQIQTQIDIDAPPERVWAVLTDFERQDWNPFIHEIRGEVREGARLFARLGPPGKKPMTFKPVVTRAEPGRALSWRGTLGAGWLFRGEHAFRLEPLGAGRTRFHHGEAFGGLLVPLLRRSLDTDTRGGFEAMNRAIKAEAERDTA
ncbi:SRPBCC domain-containing protein [Rubrivirga sp. S365]|uniref:SRPBCC domain-containing protein n=1 Tax=Rubrivirga litoralis TaxID=3075598 RepID=A0ABU3BRM9_9BACT|nr:MULTISPECIES: SRPBCC domain-containing protein [unclassified Rubrivirga]MDT0631895.1 SRPBCC domain-containing protein [Rubrivirga sp. F394]MDT7857948.1 SRPBCC domain-containing protein [Rubrivirga sp. S365]